MIERTVLPAVLDAGRCVHRRFGSTPISRWKSATRTPDESGKVGALNVLQRAAALLDQWKSVSSLSSTVRFFPISAMTYDYGDSGDPKG
jgi:hypothetical protein